jgi:anti-anti-sigma factor
MEVQILDQNGEIVVAIAGRVDTITSSELESAVSAVWAQPAITLVFDCAQMDYISSSGLRVVLKAHKQATAVGGKFILRNLNNEVRSVVDMTGFSRILTVE